MRSNHHDRRKASRLAIAGLVVLWTPCGLAVIGAQNEAGDRRGEAALGNHYDVRVLGRSEIGRVVAAYPSWQYKSAVRGAQAKMEAMREAIVELRKVLPGVRVELSPLVGAAEVVSRGGAGLTLPAPGVDGPEIVREFLRSNAAVYGLSDRQVEQLEFVAESRGGATRTVRLRQTVVGRPVFQSEMRAILDRDGRLLRTVGRLVPGIEEVAVPAGHHLGPAEALRAAMASVGVEIEPAAVVPRHSAADGSRIELAPDHPDLTRPVISEQVYFPLAPGVVVPAWAQVVVTRTAADWYTVVDARTGILLWRKNIRYHFGRKQNEDGVGLEVYVQADGTTPADSPAPGTHHGPLETRPGSEGTQFPQIARQCVEVGEGWLPSGGDTSTGNNVDAYLDRNADGQADADGRPTFSLDDCTDFEYHPPPDGTNPDTGDDPGNQDYQHGVVTHLFYLVNWFHDELEELGFDNEAGNFEGDPEERPDAGAAISAYGDRISAETQYGADRYIFNLASFTSPPDGTPGILRTSLWNGPDPDRDGALDAQLVFHELAHGVTSRLIGNSACLNWFPGRALAEGLSDFYALALLNGAGEDTPDGQYGVGNYITYKLGGHDFTDNYVYGIRRFPYSTDLDVNPLTWKDADDTIDCPTRSGEDPCGVPLSPLAWEDAGANEVHNAGELWALSLWELRSLIIEAEGGDVAQGNQETLGLVTDALKQIPCEPSFIQARDALLEAYCPDTAEDCPYEVPIWQAFAKRGLGYKAQDSGGIATHYGIKESFRVPFPDLAGDPEVVVESQDRTAAIAAGDKVPLTVTLFNPWRRREVREVEATLSCNHLVTEITPAARLIDSLAAGSETEVEFELTVAENAPPGQPLGCEIVISEEDRPDPENAPGEDPVVELDLRVDPADDQQPEEEELTVRCHCGPEVCLPEPGEWTVDGSVVATVSCGFEMSDSPRCATSADGTEKANCIPDGEPTGKVFTMDIAEGEAQAPCAVAAVIGISDLDLGIDDLKHLCVGDLTVMLKGPNGYGADLIYRLADRYTTVIDRLDLGLIIGLNDGDNLEGTIIDDESVNDLLAAGEIEAPFTGRWSPVLSSPEWFSSVPDDDRPLQHFDGTSLYGTWTLFVSDVVLGGATSEANNENNENNEPVLSWSLRVEASISQCDTSGTEPSTQRPLSDN